MCTTRGEDFHLLTTDVRAYSHSDYSSDPMVVQAYSTDLRVDSHSDQRADFVFVWFDSLRPINNLSVIKGRVFLG